LRRVLSNGRMVAAPSPMRRMRSYRLLRQFAKPTRIEAQRDHRPSHHQ
jgi:hypothetical protein